MESVSRGNSIGCKKLHDKNNLVLVILNFTFIKLVPDMLYVNLFRQSLN